jgi:hypothetical protein
MLNFYIAIMYILVSGFGGLMSGMAALLVFRLMGTYTTPDYRWFVLYVSTGVFTFIGFLNALQVLGFFPWLSRVLISSFRSLSRALRRLLF